MNTHTIKTLKNNRSLDCIDSAGMKSIEGGIKLSDGEKAFGENVLNRGARFGLEVGARIGGFLGFIATRKWGFAGAKEAAKRIKEYNKEAHPYNLGDGIYKTKPFWED